MHVLNRLHHRAGQLAVLLTIIAMHLLQPARAALTDIANTPLANDTWGLGPQFAPNGLMGANNQPVNGTFYSPAGGLYYQNNSTTTGSAVDSNPTAIPRITFVAGPLLLASAMSCTGLCLCSV